MELVIILSLSLVLVHYASGHARLLQPPSRSSMWRFGFDNPADYSDNQGFCGGIKVSLEKQTRFLGWDNHLSCLKLLKPNPFSDSTSIEQNYSSKFTSHHLNSELCLNSNFNQTLPHNP